MGKSIDRKSAKLINSGSGREASKLIKVNGWYYLIFSEHKPGVGRYVMAKRSRKLAGPYKEEKQLALPSCEAMEPNQGGIILGKDNNWYFSYPSWNRRLERADCQSVTCYMGTGLAHTR